MDFPQANTILSWSSRIKNEFNDIFQENNQAFDGKKTNLKSYLFSLNNKEMFTISTVFLNKIDKWNLHLQYMHLLDSKVQF